MSTRNRLSRSNLSSSSSFMAFPGTSPSRNSPSSSSSRRAIFAGAAGSSSSGASLLDLPRSSFVDSSSSPTPFRERRRNKRTPSALNTLHSELKFLDVQQELLFDPTVAPDDVRLEGLSLSSPSSYQAKKTATQQKLPLSETSSERYLLSSAGKGDPSSTRKTLEEGRRGGRGELGGEEEERDLDRFFKTFTAGISSPKSKDPRKGDKDISNSSSSSSSGKSLSACEVKSNEPSSSLSSSLSRDNCQPSTKTETPLEGGGEGLLLPLNGPRHTSLKHPPNHSHSHSSLPVSVSSSPPVSLGDQVLVSGGDYLGERRRSASDQRSSSRDLDASSDPGESHLRGRSACSPREGATSISSFSKMYPRSSSSSYSRRTRIGSFVDGDDLDYEGRQGRAANPDRSSQDFHISIHPPKSSSYDDILDRTSREDKKAERNAVRFAAATAGAAAAASTLGADVETLQCSVRVEEQERPLPVKDVFDQEDEEKEEEREAARKGMKRQDTSSFAPQRTLTGGASLSKDLSSSSSSTSMIGNVDRFPAKRGPSRGGGGMLGEDGEDDRGGSGVIRVYSQSRHVDERKGEGLQFPGRFPFPRGLTEMQERMEEEWIDRERRLRVQHKRELEKAIAYETEKLSREYSRRLVFELQEQEKELVAQMHDQQRQALAEMRNLADLKTDAQDGLQKAQQEISMKEQRYHQLLTDLQLIQAEKDTLIAKVHKLEEENQHLHASLVPLEKDACNHRAKEEELHLRLERTQITNERLQIQLQHEQQLAACFSNKRRGLERELEVLEEKKNTAEREWRRVEAELREVQERQAGLLGANAHLQNELDSALRHAKALEQRVVDGQKKDDERQRLSQRIEKLQEEKESIERRLSDEVASLRKRMHHLENIEFQFTALKQDFESQKIELERLRDENATLTAEVRQHTKQERSHKLDNVSMQNDILVLRQENVDLRKDLNRLIKDRNATGSGAVALSSSASYTKAAAGGGIGKAYQTYSTIPSPENTLVTRVYSPPTIGESRGDASTAADSLSLLCGERGLNRSFSSDPLLTQNDASCCPSLTGPLNGRCFTSKGEVRCTKDPSIRVSDVSSEEFSTPGQRAHQAGLRSSFTNNPIARSTKPSPSMVSETNPLVHVHHPSVASRVGMTGDLPSVRYDGYQGAARTAAAIGALTDSRGGGARLASVGETILNPRSPETPEQIASLEKQLMLLTTERKRLESELSRVPAARGRTVSERQQAQKLELRLTEVDGTIHRMKQTLLQAQKGRKKY